MQLKGAGCRWIVLWKEAGPTDGACHEAEAKDAGRFNGICSARYSKVVDGFAVEVRAQLPHNCPIRPSLPPLEPCPAQDAGRLVKPALHPTARRWPALQLWCVEDMATCTYSKGHCLGKLRRATRHRSS